MSDKAAKVPSHYTLPCCTLALIELKDVSDLMGSSVLEFAAYRPLDVVRDFLYSCQLPGGAVRAM